MDPVTAEIVFYITSSGITAMLSFVLYLLGVKPRTANARIGNPFKGEKFINEENATSFEEKMSDEDVKDWCRQFCGEEQQKLMEILNRETRIAISNTVNGWKASTTQQIKNINQNLTRLQETMDKHNERLDTVLFHIVGTR
jgi:hypothetical protein